MLRIVVFVPRATKLSLEFCTLSYRTGARLNPQEEKKIEVESDANKIEKISFETDIEEEKPKPETVIVIAPNIQRRKLFSLNMKSKKKKTVR